MADEEGTIDGIAEDDLIDDAEVDTMIREAITQVRPLPTTYPPFQNVQIWFL